MIETTCTKCGSTVVLSLEVKRPYVCLTCRLRAEPPPPHRTASLTLMRAADALTGVTTDMSYAEISRRQSLTVEELEERYAEVSSGSQHPVETAPSLHETGPQLNEKRAPDAVLSGGRVTTQNRPGTPLKTNLGLRQACDRHRPDWRVACDACNVRRSA